MLSSAELLVASVLVPTIASVLVVYVRDRKASGALAALSLVASLVLLAAASQPVLTKGETVEKVYNWIAPFAVEFGFRLDPVSFIFALLITLLSALASVYSIKYLEHKHNANLFFSMLLLFYVGMYGVVLATNLIEFYLFWELMLLPSYFLIAEWGYGERKKIALKYFLYTHFGAVAILLSIGAIYMYTGTFSLLALERAALSYVEAIPLTAKGWIVAGFMIGFAVKMALVPVHNWLPDAHAEAPTPVSALLSGVMLKCGAYAMVRMVIALFSPVFLASRFWLAPEFSISGVTLITLVAFLTMLYGGLMALAQTDIKRLLAYSSISQMGYVTLGLTVMNVYGLCGGLYHVVSHALAKGALFMVAGIFIHELGTRNIDELGGLAKKMPLTTIATFVSALSLIGVPMLSGFVSELAIFTGAFDHYGGSWEGVLYALMMLAATVITAGYYLWMMKRVFFGRTPEKFQNVKEASPLLLGPILVLAALSVIFGVFPYPLMKIIMYGVGEITKLAGW